MIENTKTQRGFALGEFLDMYGTHCSIQKSSLATADAIWLGVDDPEPKIMASQAKALGVESPETTGWVSYPIPPEVLLNTRMHLSREQVAELIPALQHFVDTGDLPANR